MSSLRRALACSRLAVRRCRQHSLGHCCACCFLRRQETGCHHPCCRGRTRSCGAIYHCCRHPAWCVFAARATRQCRAAAAAAAALHATFLLRHGPAVLHCHSCCTAHYHRHHIWGSSARCCLRSSMAEHRCLHRCSLACSHCSARRLDCRSAWLDSGLLLFAGAALHMQPQSTAVVPLAAAIFTMCGATSLADALAAPRQYAADAAAAASLATSVPFIAAGIVLRRAALGAAPHAAC